MTSNIKIIKINSEISSIILNEPKTYNSLSFKNLIDLLKVLKKLDADNKVKVIIIEGAGKGFSAGHNLKEVKRLKKKDKYWRNKKIKARFVCALSISYLSKKICCVIGKVEGIISDKPRGRNGFGYDPIFIPINKKKTFGEMKPIQKYKLDHRSKAFKKIKKFL